MGVRNPQVDKYINGAAPFAQPILRKVRDLFHKAGPQIEEKLKWGCPSFEHKGIVGGMAAFKRYVAWGLWKAKLLEQQGLMKSDKSSHMSGGNITDVSEIPPEKKVVALIRQAIELNERGVKLPQRSGKPKPLPKTPADLSSALKGNAAAAATFKAFSPSHKREYIEWITEAKSAETRARRLAQALEWMADGKPRNWKYMPKKKMAVTA
jgi:uncharacterized protein YdeI (YjbR/CyaY-like superfamily)